PDAALPQAEPLHDYDCIILGDVSPEKLPPADRKRLERYVAERGGTLLIVAGKRAMPLAFTNSPGAANDPLVKVLPIQEPQAFQPKEGFGIRLTAAGKQEAFLQLEPDAGPGGWPELPKHFWGVVGARKPGATVLARPDPAAADDQAGLLVQHSYGF